MSWNKENAIDMPWNMCANMKCKASRHLNNSKYVYFYLMELISILTNLASTLQMGVIYGK